MARGRIRRGGEYAQVWPGYVDVLSTLLLVVTFLMSIFMLAFRGGMPLGNLLAGFVAQRWSITVALVVNGTVLAVIALIFIIRRTDLDSGLPPAVHQAA